MANRLSTIVTKTGDSGYTGLGDGSRVLKCHQRVCVMGDLDEFSCHIGSLLLSVAAGDHRALLKSIQQDIFDIGGELCIPGSVLFNSDRIEFFEAQISKMNSVLPRLEEFILPNGIRSAVDAHICRATVRRAERNLVKLSQTESVRPELLRYLNRLSDFFFVFARLLNQQTTGPLAAETLWAHKR